MNNACFDLQLRLDPSKGFECYVDADAAGMYICNFAAMDHSTANLVQVGMFSMLDAP